MGESKILYRMKVPYKITLYLNGTNPNIYYYFTWKKKSHRGSTGTDIVEESRKKVLEIFYEISKGIREKGRQKVIKFEEVMKRFLNHKESDVTKRTLEDYTKSSKFLLERYKGRDIQTIYKKTEYTDYQEWRRTYYTTHKKTKTFRRYGKPVKGRSIKKVGNVVLNREVRLLVSVLRYGKEYMNLFKGIDIPGYKKLDEKPRDELLTKDEYIRLKTYWMEKNPFYGHIITFLANTGVRYPSETYPLQWKNINLKEGYVEIRNRKSRYNKLTSLVPLVGSARNSIIWLQSREGISTGPDDYVFVDSKGTRVKRIVKSFKKSLVDCGINKNLTLYGFRHLFTTKMVQRSDIPLPVLAQVLGHTDTFTLQKHYLHLNPKENVRIFRRSDEKIRKDKRTEKGNTNQNRSESK